MLQNVATRRLDLLFAGCTGAARGACVLLGIVASCRARYGLHDAQPREPPMTDTSLSLRLVRDVPISPEQCFEGWTVPERLIPWFCPRPWHVVDCVIDLRPGGAFGTTMQSPEGVDLPSEAGCYLAVEAPHRLVWTNLLGPGFTPTAIQHPGFGFVCELRFDRLPDGGTRYQATVHHVDAAGRDAHAAMGFEAGWSAALDQLVELMLGPR